MVNHIERGGVVSNIVALNSNSTLRFTEGKIYYVSEQQGTFVVFPNDEGDLVVASMQEFKPYVFEDQPPFKK